MSKKRAIAAPSPGGAGQEPFWRRPLESLTRPEWESLCDGCGKCCLIKLEDEDTGDVHFTSVACRLLDVSTCRCSDYKNRAAKVPDCIRLTRAKVAELKWLPPTCAYRLRANGEDLPPWHPLISGDPESVHRAGVSVMGKIEGCEDEIEEDDLPDYIVAWPRKWPRKARPA